MRTLMFFNSWKFIRAKWDLRENTTRSFSRFALKLAVSKNPPYMEHSKRLPDFFYLSHCRPTLFSVIISFSQQPTYRIIHISPISVKLCQFKGSTAKLKKTNWLLFKIFPGVDRPPPGFSWFSLRKSLHIKVKCMKLSLRWYLTNYPEGLHTYYYILSKCSTHPSVMINGLSINKGK